MKRDEQGRALNGPDDLPAFPNHPASHVPFRDWSGMTMRQWYAGKAMQAWLSTYGENDTHPAHLGSEVSANIARWSFEIADAMIAHEAKEMADG